MTILSRSLTCSIPHEASASRESPSLSDQTLIGRFLATGDDAYFEALVQRYQDRVFRLALSVLGPGVESDAEDLTQEVFVLVYRKLHTFRGDGAFAPWLYQVTRNRAIDRRRRTAARALPVDAGMLERLPDRATRRSPLSAATARERRSRVLSAIDGLDEPQRSVVLLHYWLDWTVTEIGGSLGVPAGTIKSHLHRARKNLAAALREERPDD